MSDASESEIYTVEILRSPPGEKLSETWSAEIDGKLVKHRIDGPAHLAWTVGSAEPTVVGYYVRGVLHREDGPAHRQISSSGDVVEMYYSRGEPHRTDGPAYLEYDSTGIVRSSEHWFEGQRIDRPKGIDFIP